MGFFRKSDISPKTEFIIAVRSFEYGMFQHYKNVNLPRESHLINPLVSCVLVCERTFISV